MSIFPENLEQELPPQSVFRKEFVSQTETKLDSQDPSEQSLKTESLVQEALKGGNQFSFEYLNSGKTFDPKHLPIEDKGKVYYYQDDPVLYKKIKK
jgi:hypothetical protein